MVTFDELKKNQDNIVSIEDLKNYVLICREEEMGNNYELSDHQMKLIRKVSEQVTKDPELKNMLSQMLSSKSTAEMNSIQTGGIIDLTPTDFIEPEKTKEVEKGKVLVFKNKFKNKKAGYIDALVMALVTGFVSGIAATILLIACQ